MQLEENNISSNLIMVVDDERDLVSLFKDALESVGFHAYGFTDPLLALEHFTLNTGKYCMIVSDIRMPGITGIELSERIRQISQDVTVILMSAFDFEDSGITSLKIASFLLKLVKISDFIAKVREQLDGIKETS